MFGKQTGDRFEKGKGSEVSPGPGSYDLPSTLDNKGAILDWAERFQEMSESGSPNPNNESFAREADSSLMATPTPRPATPRPSEKEKDNKENRMPAPPLSARGKGPLRSSSPRSFPQPPSKPSTTGKAPPGPPASLVGDADARKHRDLRLASQLDMVREELKQKSKEAKELQLSMATKDRRIDELQKRMEELGSDYRESRRSTAEVEGELATKRRQLHDKEQELLALQRKHEHLRSQNEDRSREKKEEEFRAMSLELQRAKACAETAASERSAMERDAKQSEQKLHQQQRRFDELEGGLQSHIEVLEEQLAREVARRREMEAQQEEVGAERHHGECQLEESQKRCDDLQRMVEQLQEELKTKIATAITRADEQAQLEDEVQTLRAEKEGLLGTAAVSARRLEVCQKELNDTTSKSTALEAESQKREEHCQDLEQKVKSAERRMEELETELSDERMRNEDLEKRAAEFQGKEKAARTELDRLQGRQLDPSLQALEARALRAEAEAEQARQVLERWKEWGDEQQLRELSAETERLERLKQVREEVTSQVEEARKELVAENRALHRKIEELESGTASKIENAEELRKQLADQAALRQKAEAEAKESARRASKGEAELSALQAAVDASLSRLDDQRLELQRQCSEAESRAKSAEEKIAHLTDDLVAQRQKLDKEREAAEAERSAHRHVAEQTGALKEAAGLAHGRLVLSRWRSLVDGGLQSWAFSAQQELWARAKRAAFRGRETSARAEDVERLQSQEEELERLDQECEDLREQNKEVLLSLQLQQQDLQMAMAETRRLSEREAAYESEMLRVSERSAELGGHSNPKQKIKHLMAVKEENQSLRQELKRSRQLAAQLEVQLRTAHFFDPALSSEPQTSRSVSRSAAPSTPGRVTTALSVDRTPKARGVIDPDKADQRCARAHRRALERSANAYQHLYMLVERALAAGTQNQKAEHFVIHSDVGTPATTANTAASTAISLAATPARKAEEGAADGDHQDLYRRLRALSLALSGESEASRADLRGIQEAAAAPYEEREASET